MLRPVEIVKGKKDHLADPAQKKKDHHEGFCRDSMTLALVMNDC